jgi:four helix bundle protein
MNCLAPATETAAQPIPAMQRFTKLRVWQVAHAWVLDIYRTTRLFPPEERFGLTSQLRKSASSVSANVAEGSKRRSNIDYARFINQAEASVSESENHLILARDLGYASAAEVEILLDGAAEIGRMLDGLRKSVEARA